MRQHAPEIDRFLRSRGIFYVRAEYSGRDGQGGFGSLHFGVAAGNRKLERKATLRALLLSRYPDWLNGSGS
jgi:hypothetical protein